MLAALDLSVLDKESDDDDDDDEEDGIERHKGNRELGR